MGTAAKNKFNPTTYDEEPSHAQQRASQGRPPAVGRGNNARGGQATHHQEEEEDPLAKQREQKRLLAMYENAGEEDGDEGNNEVDD
jgi:hypothetical protein